MPAIAAARHPDVYGAGEYAQGTGGSPRVPGAEQSDSTAQGFRHQQRQVRLPIVMQLWSSTRVGRRGAHGKRFVAGASTT